MSNDNFWQEYRKSQHATWQYNKTECLEGNRNKKKNTKSCRIRSRSRASSNRVVVLRIALSISSRETLLGSSVCYRYTRIYQKKESGPLDARHTIGNDQNIECLGCLRRAHAASLHSRVHFSLLSLSLSLPLSISLLCSSHSINQRTHTYIQRERERERERERVREFLALAPLSFGSYPHQY